MTILFGVVAILFLWRVIDGPKPWDTAIAERHAADKPAHIDDYLRAGFWWGALVNAILAAALAGTAFLWANRRRIETRTLVRQPDSLASKRFWLVLAAIIIVAIVPRVARLNFSFWGDEAWAYNDLLHGRYSEADDGSLEFKRHPWKITAFFDKGTNNHYLFSLGARVSDNLWRSATGAADHIFNEASVRVLPLIAGLASIILAAALLRRMGFSHAGLALAALLAIHPWHIRYSSEARGYTMLIVFLILALWFLFNALENGTWRWWIAFGLAEFGALYSWKAAIHPILALNLTTFVLIILQRSTGGAGFAQLCRWAVANVIALMLFVPLFAPAIGQIQRKLAASIQAKGKMGMPWFRDFWSQLTAAMDWSNSDPHAVFETATTLNERIPIFHLFMFVVIPLLSVIGFFCCFRKQRTAAVLLVSILIGGGIGFLHFQLSGNVMLKWYLFYTLPFFLAFVAISLSGVARPWPLTIYVAIFLVFTAGHSYRLATIPFQDQRAASEATRYANEERFHLGPSEIVTVGLYRRSVLYDPRIRQKWKGERLRTAELLMDVMRDSDARSRELRISIANMNYARVENESFVDLVENRRYFRPIRVFPAGEEYITIHTFEYIPGSLDG